MSTENAVPAAILLKIRKLQELARRGVGGEAQNAQRVLEALCEKYGLALEDLDQDEKKTYTFPLRASVRPLFANCFTHMFGASTRFTEDYTLYRNTANKKQWAELNLTAAEYIEFSQFWEWHKHNFLQERAAMRKAFQSAYIEKHALFTNDLSDEIREEFNSRKAPTLEERLAIEALAMTLKNNTYHKQIGTNTDEEDEE